MFVFKTAPAQVLVFSFKQVQILFQNPPWGAQLCLKKKLFILIPSVFFYLLQMLQHTVLVLSAAKFVVCSYSWVLGNNIEEETMAKDFPIP